jgi:hypothetical protein
MDLQLLKYSQYKSGRTINPLEKLQGNEQYHEKKSTLLTSICWRGYICICVCVVGGICMK